jgi:hypothetical protein
VAQINYITKTRAHRYVAAADKDWLFPERHLSSTHWRNFGNGYLLMPEPRAIHMGGETYIGYDSGRSEAFSEYGHRPWQRDFEDKRRYAEESKALERFKVEWALKHGPTWRGTSAEFGRRVRGPHVESEKFHQLRLDQAKKLHVRQSASQT